MTDTKEVVIRCSQVNKSYSQGSTQINVLRDINLSVSSGDEIAIVGISGSGKTTLLNLLGGLDLPSSGIISVAGKNLNKISESDRGFLRNKYLGFVFQFHHLLGEFNALENVAMPLFIAGCGREEAEVRSETILKRVGLINRIAHKPSELSGGERQRVAIARALINNPQCVLLDEPTGNLDKFTAAEIRDLLTDLNGTFRTSFITVTHDELLASTMSRKLTLEGGVLNE
jgi:lipoprotein-releasing system ATP-binding protein